MSLESAWSRLMRYCDGEDFYTASGYADQVREHLRTDIMTVNDARLEQIATAEREWDQAQGAIIAGAGLVADLRTVLASGTTMLETKHVVALDKLYEWERHEHAIDAAREGGKGE